VELGDLVGRWRRGLLRTPHAPDDRSSDVTWVQGPSRYVDLRLPAGDPPVTAAPPAGLDDVAPADLLRLAGRQGFAGTCRLAGGVASWQRRIDLQPPAPSPDEGRLTLLPRPAGELPGTSDLLVETGVHASYVEHWWRDGPAGTLPAACASGHDEQGRTVIVVRAGRFVGLARDRDVALPADVRDLAEAVRGAADVGAARRLVDCELSWGRADPSGWRLQASSLPWRVGVTLRPRWTGGRLELSAGTSSAPTDRWTLTDVTGQESLLHRFTPSSPAPSSPAPTVR